MVLKSKDKIASQLSELEELLRLRLSARQLADIKREIAWMKSGHRAEREAAFEIDFRLEDHKDWMIIHDLRLEHNDRVAQIDHLVFFPTWEFYVVETKGIHTKVKIEDGQWTFLQDNHWRGMADSIEQNNRHIQVLRELLLGFKLIPRTMGVAVAPRFINVVLVPPECVIRKTEKQAWLVHMDQFVTRARRDFSLHNAMRNLIQIHSGKDARKVGEKLVAMHVPFKQDYRKRFGIGPVPMKAANGKKVLASAAHCESCRIPITNAEASFCRINKDRFAGQLLCRKCQGYAPAAIIGPIEKPKPKVVVPPGREAGASQCAECGAAVDSRVIAFCLADTERFGGRVLCRKCQIKVRKTPRK
jgi:hypothetical protein